MRFAATLVAALPLFFSADVLAGWHDDPDCSSTITNYLPKSTSIVILPTSTWTGHYVKATSEDHVPVIKPHHDDNSDSDRGHESDNNSGDEHEGKGSGRGSDNGSGSEGGSGSENADHGGDKGDKGGEPVPPPPVQAGASSGKPETLVVASLVALVGLFFVY